MDTTVEKNVRRLALIFTKIKSKLSKSQFAALEKLYWKTAGFPVTRLPANNAATAETVWYCSRIGTAMFKAMGEKPRGHTMMMVGCYRHHGGQEYWIMRPDVRRALKQLAWFERAEPTLDQTSATDSDGMAEYHRAFNDSVCAALRDTVAARRERLRHAPLYPTFLSVNTRVPIRNPDVVAEVLHRANGKCERCHQPAPFRRLRGGMPYLEVHHRIMLSEGGPDTVDNAIATCPNCHRLLHYGVPQSR